MTASIDFDIFKQELARAIRELQNASSTVDLQLLEELYLDDEDRDDSSYKTLVATTQRNLLVAQARLSRALHDVQQYWDSVLRSTDRLGDEEQRRNLYEHALLHWQSQGGDQVQREAKSLADQIDTALQLLPQIYTPHLSQAADRQPTTPTQPLQRRLGLTTPATPTAINKNPDGSSRWDEKLKTVEHLPQTSPHAQACSEEEIRQERHELLPQEQFVRLPKFDLPMFAGDIDKFPAFWDAFNLALLPQVYTPQLPQAADRQPMTPTQPQQRRSGLMTPATSTAINQNPDDNYRRDGKLNAVAHLPQALPHAQACSDEEIRQGQHEPLPQEQFVRLPKFDLPMFAGDIDRFPEFWDAFNSAVHANPTISPVVKFHHLRSLLKGDAQAVVAGYDITQSNYELAIKTLHETYYRPQLIRTQLSVRLQTMKPAGPSPLHQRTTLAQIRSLWLQLEKLGDHEDNIFVMRLIRQKFPQRTLEHLGTIETADPTPWKVPQLLSGLDRAIKTFETIADTAERAHTSTYALALRTETEARSSSEDSSRFCRHCGSTRSRTPTRRAATSRSRDPCAFCKRFGHATATCHLVTTIAARTTIVIEEDLCRKCFAPTHFAFECDKPPCSRCRRDHHRTLCP
ncbi:hypothetical protein GCK32_015987, partial [Trichostrongylus colubriformis]